MFVGFEDLTVDVCGLAGAVSTALREAKLLPQKQSSRAGAGNDINAGSAGFQEARHRGVLDKSESG